MTDDDEPMRVSPTLFPVGYIMPDFRFGMGDEHVIVVDDEGNTIPFVHGGFVSRDQHPQLVDVLVRTYSEWAKDDGVVLPDFRARVIVEHSPE